MKKTSLPVSLLSFALAFVFAAMLLAPAGASAQEQPRTERTAVTSVFSYMSRGMLGILTEAVPVNSMNARQRVVLDVVEDGPADKAGVMKGDTLISINGLAASQQAMNLPFEPGDEVVLRLRRDGVERDVTVVATERTARYRTTQVFPDSVGERISIVMDRVNSNLADARAHLESIELPRVRVITTTDSLTTIVIGADTIRTLRTLRGPQEFFRIHPDSFPEMGGWMGFQSVPGDSVWRRSVWGDTANFRFAWSGDSAFFARPLELLASGGSIGMRAVGGAELAPLNPGLAEYFGATDGVLVIDARDGTPAARAGLRSGDVITHVNGEMVTSIQELRRLISRATGDVRLGVLRNGLTTDVVLPRE